jgi:hypothetical protein
MAYAVRLRGVILGHSDLELTDSSMGVATGAFRPAADYELVRPIFRLFAEATSETSAEPTDEERLARYYAARDALPLELVDERVRVIRTSSIHIADYSFESGPAAMELEVVIVEPKFWARVGSSE